jgi:hypothetical protein
MTFKDIADLLESTGLPCAYYSYPEGNVPALPYIVFYYPNNNPEYADNQVFTTITALNIELYTQNKDFTTEQTVEAVLNANELPFNKSEIYLTDEHMYEVLYQTQVVIDPEQE